MYNFTYKGTFLKKATYTLPINSELDINNDGLPDLSYAKPKHKRAGFEDSVYLNFISSQETLQTTMFAVLKEQYYEEQYPNGLIGINPNGKFIISEYAQESSMSRSLVAGYLIGDYALDTKTGEYKVVQKNNKTNIARSLTSEELIVINDNQEDSYLFTENDFVMYDKEALLEKIPFSIKNNISQDLNSIEKLNTVLRQKDLIELIKAVQEIPIPSDIYPEVLSQINKLTETEIIQLNRIFLEETFPEFCPVHQTKSIVYSEVLPLVDLDLGKAEQNDTIVNLNRTACVNLDEYETKRKPILAEYEQYKEIWSIDLTDKLKKNIHDIDIELGRLKIGLGYKGHFNSSWGNLSQSSNGVVLIDFSSFLKAKYKYSGTLLEDTVKGLNIPFTIGPIPFNFTLDSGFQLPLEVSFDTKVPIVFTSAITGLYGVGYSASLDYGVKWKKIWFIKYPSPYIDWNASSWKCNKTAYYIGSSNPLEEIEISNTIISINPKLVVDFGIDICKIVGADFAIYPGVKPILNLTCKDKNLVAKATIQATLDGSAGVFMGIKDVPIFNLVTREKRWNLFHLDYEIDNWELFNINF